MLMSDADFLTQAKSLFRDPGLLMQALTHPSYCNETQDECADNERLEFLGDAVIDLIVAEMLYQRAESRSEGEMTRLRAALVNTEALGTLAGRLGVGEVLRMGRGEVAGGGRTRHTNLCAALEAMVGALYLDSGMEAARVFMLPLLTARLDEVQAASLDRDARSALQERMQAETGYTPRYVVVGQSGPDHAREWQIQVYVGEWLAGEGVGRSKQAASQAAARDALKRIEAGQIPLSRS